MSVLIALGSFEDRLTSSWSSGSPWTSLGAPLEATTLRTPSWALGLRAFGVPQEGH